MTSFSTRHKRSFKQVAILATLAGVGTLFASTEAGPKMPANFQPWYVANSMIVTKEPDPSGLIAGVHLIHVNTAGVARLKTGGSTAYPDGTMFVDDVRDFSMVGNAYQEGARKFLTVMVKDSKKYASTGGWGFQAWVGGDPSKPIVTNAATQCFGCHTPKKANDYVFSTYLK
jgi:hypothetical protein